MYDAMELTGRTASCEIEEGHKYRVLVPRLVLVLDTSIKGPFSLPPSLSLSLSLSRLRRSNSTIVNGREVLIWNLGSCTARSCWFLGNVELTILLIYSENMGSFSKCSQSLRVSSASPDNSASCSSLGRMPLHLEIRLKRLKGGPGWKAIPDNVLALDKATKVSPALNSRPPISMTARN